MNRDYDEQLATLKEIRGFLGDILVISTQELEILEQEDEQAWPMDTIHELLDSRQQIIERIDELDSLLKNGTINSTINQELYGVLQENIRSVIQNILANDAKIQSKLKVGMRTMTNKITQTRENKKAQLAYDREDINTSAWFFDKKQ